MRLLLFSVEDRLFATPVERVARVIRAVEITPLMTTSGAVSGIIDVAGEVAGVVDLRQRLDLPARGVRPDDQIILLTAQGRMFGLLADSTMGVIDAPDETPQRTADDGRFPAARIRRTENGLAIVLSPDHLLSSEAARILDQIVRTHHEPETARPDSLPI